LRIPASKCLAGAAPVSSRNKVRRPGSNRGLLILLPMERNQTLRRSTGNSSSRLPSFYDDINKPSALTLCFQFVCI
uniref:Ovule protein n=1 Tax=Echinostoma caproni TaxID=27848 RepID=A0A183BBN8_9TREM